MISVLIILYTIFLLYHGTKIALIHGDILSWYELSIISFLSSGYPIVNIINFVLSKFTNLTIIHYVGIQVTEQNKKDCE